MTEPATPKLLVRLVAWTVTALLTASACVRLTSEGTTEEDRSRSSVQAMLRERAQRLGSGDVEGYLRPLSPEARAVEEPIARGASGVPLEAIQLLLGQAFSEPSRMRSARIELSYRYKGLPEDNPFRIGFLYDLEESDGAWRVVSSKLDPEVVPPIWATGPVQVVQSPHFLVLHRPGVARVSEAVSLAEKARAQLAPRLTLQVDERHLMLLARDAAEVVALIGPPGGAIAYARSTVIGDPPRAAGREMTVNLEHALGPAKGRVHGHPGQVDVSPVEVFQHELAHLALFRFTGVSTPDWVVEGAAMYLAGERRLLSWRAYVRGRLLDAPELSLVSIDRQADLAGAQYPYANAAALYLVEKAGPAVFFEFYRGFHDLERPAPGGPQGGAPDPERTNILLRRHYQFDLGELERQVDDWIRRVVARG